MTLLELNNISRSYGPVRALANVNLWLEPGTIGLVGNNGAGKSTLLKIMLGLLRPDAGSGSILGFDVRHASRALRGRVGYMSESAALVPVMRGAEYVALSGDLYGMPHRDARRRAHEVLNYVGLGELRYRRLEEYSTGNLQRLKLAAALVHDPELLLLDEPTNGLDPAGRESMLRLIRELIAQSGKSVILCTHLLGDVERVCRQVVVLDRGAVVRSGTLEELRRARGNRYELGWQGDGAALLRALESLGAKVHTNARPGRAWLDLPDGLGTSALFAAAAEVRTVISHLRPDEEDLERLFFRVTTSSAAPADKGQRESP